MAIYHYPQSELLDRLEVRSPRLGIAQAVIVPKKNVEISQLEQLRSQLGAHKFSTLMDEVDGQPVIQVRGLKDEKKLLATLGELGLTHGEVKKEVRDGDERKLSFGDKVRGKSLFLSALFYDLGNAAFIVSGIQRGRHNKGGKFTSNDISELLIGGAFSVGDVVMTAYGHDKGDEELTVAARAIKRHLHQKGIEIPGEETLNPDTLHESGIMKATDRWMRKHVIDIKCLAEFAGGLFTVHSAVKPGNRNNGKMAAGFLISSGWLATLLLDKSNAERMIDGDKSPPFSLAEKVMDSPRNLIARPLAVGNNVANLWGSLNGKTGERARFRSEVVDAQRQFSLNPSASNRAHLQYTQVKQHDYLWNVVSAASFMVANTLFGLSGKQRPDDTQDDKALMNDVVLLSANVLAQQPGKVRDAAIEETADYVSHFAHINATKAEIKEAIAAKVESLTHSQWAQRVKQPPAAQPQLGV